jgi:glyoxylase-like metal-dependent hydrolase (beta-lactamase superfamily II)
MKEWQTNNGVRVSCVLTGRSNVYLISTQHINILFDTSIKKSQRLLAKALDFKGIKHIDYLILSHTHFDHAGNAGFIKTNYAAKVILNQKEENILRNGIKKLPGGTNWFTKQMINLLGEKQSGRIFMPKCDPDICIESEYSFKEQGLDAILVSTPGHSIGSMSLIIGGEIALVGDTMVNIVPWSIYPPFADDTNQLLRSWKKLLDTGSELFLPSHGKQITRRKLMKNYFRRNS